MSGNRLFSSAASRNSGPISNILSERLPRNAYVLEIASGSGEHGIAICQKRPDVSWQMSDIDENYRKSQDDWRTEFPDQIKPSLPLSMTDLEWWGGLGQFDAIYCANMIHIAPWEAALGLAEGAGAILTSGNLVVFYGPFKEGARTAQSNLNFDQNLKSRNPAWGVRDLDSVKHIFADVGFNLQARIEMPAENRILLFSKT